MKSLAEKGKTVPTYVNFNQKKKVFLISFLKIHVHSWHTSCTQIEYKILSTVKSPRLPTASCQNEHLIRNLIYYSPGAQTTPWLN